MRKVIRHQTRKRIEKLTSAGRSEGSPEIGYSSSELGGYESLFRIIASRTGEHPGESKDEARQRTIRESYREETRWPGTDRELAALFKNADWHVFKLWGHTEQFELVEQIPHKAYSVPAAQPSAQPQPYISLPFEPISAPASSKGITRPAPPQRCVEQSAVKLAPPTRKWKCAGYTPGNNGDCWCKPCLEYQAAMSEWHRQQYASHNTALRDGVPPAPESAQNTAVDTGTTPNNSCELASGMSRAEYDEISGLKFCANWNFMLWKQRRDLEKRTSHLVDAVTHYKETRLRTLRYRYPKAYWQQVLKDNCIRAERMAPDMVETPPELADCLLRLCVFKQSLSELQWRSQQIAAEPVEDQQGIRKAIESHVKVLESALGHFRHGVRCAVDAYKNPVVVEI